NAPCVEVDDREMGMFGVQLVRIQTEACQRAWPVPEHEDVSRGGQLPNQLERGWVGEISGRRALTGACVYVLVKELGHPRRIDPQHVCPERGEELGRPRAGEHPGEVEHPKPGEARSLLPVARAKPDPRLRCHATTLRA